MYISNQNMDMNSLSTDLNSNYYSNEATKATIYPSLTIENKVVPYESTFSSTSGSQGSWTHDNNNSLLFQVNWNLIDFQNYALINSSHKNYLSQEFNYIAALQTNSLESGKIFIQYLYNREQLKNIKNLIDIYQKEYTDSKRLFEKGQISRIDLVNAEQQIYSYKSQALAIESDLANSLLSAETYLGKKLCNSTGIDSSILRTIPESYVSEDRNQKAINISPELQSIQQSIASINFNMDSYKASFYPSLSIGASATIDTTNLTSSVDNSINDDYAVNATISWEFKPSNLYSIKSGSLASKSKNLAYEYKIVELNNTLNTLAISIPNYLKSITLAQSALNSQKEIMRLTQIGYKSGYKDFSDLEQATSSYFDSLNLLTEAHYNYLVRLIEYESYLLFPYFDLTSTNFK
jgi:protease secretion system outer membrane protein